MRTPKQVIEAAQGRIDCGGRVRQTGWHDGERVYTCTFAEPVVIGMPEFYLWNGERVRVVNGGDGERLLLELLRARRKGNK